PSRGRASPTSRPGRTTPGSALGCDGGTIIYNIGADRLAAAIVFAPEVVLEDAMAMLPACGVGFQNALGALAPPEVAVHLTWEGGILVNGAACGRLRAAASDCAPEDVPDWLAVGLEVPLIAEDVDAPGAAPDRTSLYEEGCVEVAPDALLESWSRHTLVWINRWSDDGAGPLHGEWRGLAHGIGEEVSVGGRTGLFVGVDERFGMLLREGEATSLLPLSGLLERGGET
ncbi:MAG: DUF4444 domain-containing protein, partial [Alphaproteobacteria bacterium]|nr:DUF4444 domain-containing protein [Alphaproteobacteria bacterium]